MWSKKTIVYSAVAVFASVYLCWTAYYAAIPKRSISSSNGWKSVGEVPAEVSLSGTWPDSAERVKFVTVSAGMRGYLHAYMLECQPEGIEDYAGREIQAVLSGNEQPVVTKHKKNPLRKEWFSHILYAYAVDLSWGAELRGPLIEYSLPSDSQSITTRVFWNGNPKSQILVIQQD